MPPIDPAADPHLAAYAAEMQRLADLALSGQIDERQYREEVERATLALLLLLFLLGGGAIAAYDKAMATQIKQTKRGARRLASDLYDGRYSPQAGDVAGVGAVTAAAAAKRLQARLQLWSVKAANTYETGKLHAPPTVDDDGQPQERRYTWRRGPTREGCEDCIKLDGVTLTASEWQRLGIRPGDPSLACGGWNCLCYFEEAIAESVGLAGVPT